MTFITFLIGLNFCLHAYVYFSLRIKLENALVALRNFSVEKDTIHHKKKKPVKRPKRTATQLTIQ